MSLKSYLLIAILLLLSCKNNTPENKVIKKASNTQKKDEVLKQEEKKTVTVVKTPGKEEVVIEKPEETKEETEEDIKLPENAYVITPIKKYEESEIMKWAVNALTSLYDNTELYSSLDDSYICNVDGLPYDSGNEKLIETNDLIYGIKAFSCQTSTQQESKNLLGNLSLYQGIYCSLVESEILDFKSIEESSEQNIELELKESCFDEYWMKHFLENSTQNTQFKVRAYTKDELVDGWQKFVEVSGGLLGENNKTIFKWYLSPSFYGAQIYLEENGATSQEFKDLSFSIRPYEGIIRFNFFNSIDKHLTRLQYRGVVSNIGIYNLIQNINGFDLNFKDLNLANLIKISGDLKSGYQTKITSFTSNDEFLNSKDIFLDLKPLCYLDYEENLNVNPNALCPNKNVNLIYPFVNSVTTKKIDSSDPAYVHEIYPAPTALECKNSAEYKFYEEFILDLSQTPPIISNAVSSNQNLKVSYILPSGSYSVSLNTQLFLDDVLIKTLITSSNNSVIGNSNTLFDITLAQIKSNSVLKLVLDKTYQCVAPSGSKDEDIIWINPRSSDVELVY